MSIQVRILRDEVSPSLNKLIKSTADLRPALEAVGLQVVSITHLAFRDSTYRMAPWAPKRDGSVATLIKNNKLMTGIRVVKVTNTSVTVGSDRVYAAAQQFGATIRPKAGKKFLVFESGGKKIFARKVVIPPRPFFPVSSDGQVWSRAQDKVMKALQAALMK